MPIKPPNLKGIPRTERYAAIGAVVTAIALSGLKFWAYYLTESAAVFSDALESLVNVAASGFALYALALAHEPADESHPYGHGKVEFLSATFEGGMIFAAGAVVFWQAVVEWLAGPETKSMGAGAILLGVAMGINGVLGLILLRIGRKRNSLALEADGKHLLSDVVTSVGVLGALGLVVLTGWRWIDPLAALLVGAYLLYAAYGLLRKSIAGLMDEQDESDTRLINDLLDAHVRGERQPTICSYHKVRHRHTGRMHWVDFHLMVPSNTSVYDGHKVACAIEGEIETALGEADATAHIEPCDGCVRCGVR